MTWLQRLRSLFRREAPAAPHVPCECGHLLCFHRRDGGCFQVVFGSGMHWTCRCERYVAAPPVPSRVPDTLEQMVRESKP
jgi:hypothetical protein